MTLQRFLIYLGGIDDDVQKDILINDNSNYIIDETVRSIKEAFPE